MNNNNVFFQLRERDNNVVAADRENGNFNVNLKRPLILNNGDELLINKAIIDTRAIESDKIILDNDISIEIDFSYYLLNDTIDNRLDANGDNPYLAADLDYELYILAQPNNVSTNSFELREVTFLNTIADDPSIYKPWIAYFKYTDLNNTTRVANVLMTLKEVIGTDQFNWTSPELTYGISIDGKFTLTNSTDQLRNEGIGKFPDGQAGTLQLKINEDPLPSNSYTPYISKTSIILKAGDYNYSDFADRINQEITFINPNDSLATKYPNGNNTLLLNSGHPIYDLTTTGLYQKGSIWVRAKDGEKAFKLVADSVTAGKFYFGTNQFVISFDESTNRFYFKYLNMPIYDEESGNQSIKFENLTGNNIKLTNKSSGILIDSIITTDLTTGLNMDIFNKILGFNLSSLTPNYTIVNNDTATGTNARLFKCALSDGINTTGGLSSLDTIVEKITSPIVVDACKKVPDLAGLGYILIDQQNEIYADKAVGLGAALSFGYHVIAIDGLQGDFITRDDIKNNIFAIISRYYSSNNYTVGSPEDAIIYTHRGKPQILNNLNVRILG